MEADKIIGRIEDLLQIKQDDSWNKWSKYTLKTIEDLSEDIKIINKSRETMLIRITELTSSVDRIEVSIQTFTNFKEDIINPLRIKVAILAVLGGFTGGLLATCLATCFPFILKYLLGSPA